MPNNGCRILPLKIPSMSVSLISSRYFYSNAFLRLLFDFTTIDLPVVVTLTKHPYGS